MNNIFLTRYNNIDKLMLIDNIADLDMIKNNPKVITTIKDDKIHRIFLYSFKKTKTKIIGNVRIKNAVEASVLAMKLAPRYLPPIAIFIRSTPL